MAANKFATLVHKNTNKLTLILVYVALEWVLIFMLLLNALFSYLILRFTQFFGLQTPCIFCSRIDHLFDPKKNKNFHTDLLCEAHVSEISKLGFISIDPKSGEFEKFCENCSETHFELENFEAITENLKEISITQLVGIVKSNEFQEIKLGVGEVKVDCSVSETNSEKFCENFSETHIELEKFEAITDNPKGDSITQLVGIDKSDEIEEIKSGAEEVKVDCAVSEAKSEKFCENFSETHIELEKFEAISDNRKGVSITQLVGLEKSDEIEEIKLGAGEIKVDCSVSETNSEKFCENFSETHIELEKFEAINDNLKGDLITQLVEIEKSDEFEEIKLGAGEIKVDCSVSETNSETHIVLEKFEAIIDNSKGDSITQLAGIEKSDEIEEIKSGPGEVKADCSIYETNSEKFCENFSETHIVLENFEAIIDNSKENSISQLVGIIKSDEFEEIKLGAGEVEADCFVSEANLGMSEKESIEGDEMNLITVIEDQFCSENRITNEIEVCGDQNLDIFAVFESLEREGNTYDSQNFQTKNCDFVSQQRSTDSLAGEAGQMALNESEDDVSIGTEIPDIESTDVFRLQEIYVKEDDHGAEQVEEEVIELKTISIDATNHQIKNYINLPLEPNDFFEEKIPSTPSSIASLHNLYKKILVEKKESGTEESLDGSTISEFEGGEVTSTELLISILKAERKALNDLFMELEEERSANAIAANQTMAMINRLQEEKAAMQMEALHYQRMMEEQSQYDQEALEFLNLLILTREKEKKELEKELEVYRKRVNLETVGKESEIVSFSSSNCGDSDGLSIEGSGEDSFDEEKMDQNTPIEAILCIDESSVKLKEERLRILDRLKVLEEKFLANADEGKEENFDAVEFKDLIFEENHVGKMNGIVNGFTTETNGNYEVGKRIMGIKAKRLLPLFEATDNGHSNGSPPDMLQNSISENIEFENRNFDIEEEYDRLYERLQALEAHKEFRYLRQ